MWKILQSYKNEGQSNGYFEYVHLVSGYHTTHVVVAHTTDEISDILQEEIFDLLRNVKNKISFQIYCYLLLREFLLRTSK